VDVCMWVCVREIRNERKKRQREKSVGAGKEEGTKTAGGETDARTSPVGLAGGGGAHRGSRDRMGGRPP